MALHLGQVAPNFAAETTQGRIDFHEWLNGSWAVLFSHPADFTPVCTTELGAAARLQKEFEKRGVKLIALSVDPVESHKAWIADINETQGASVTFPIIADPERRVAELYDMIHPELDSMYTVRSVFIIGPDKRIKLTFTYPGSTGRNFTELLRVIDSLQLVAKHKVATPVDWKPGEECIISLAVKDAEIPNLFPKGSRKVKPYLRFTPNP